MRSWTRSAGPWRRESVGLDGFDAAAPEGLSPEDNDAVRAALRQLPERQRATVVLRFWCGLSVEETREDHQRETAVNDHDGMTDQDDLQRRIQDLHFHDEPPMTTDPSEDVTRGRRSLHRRRLRYSGTGLVGATAAVAALALVGPLATTDAGTDAGTDPATNAQEQSGDRPGKQAGLGAAGTGSGPPSNNPGCRRRHL